MGRWPLNANVGSVNGDSVRKAKSSYDIRPPREDRPPMPRYSSASRPTLPPNPEPRLEPSVPDTSAPSFEDDVYGYSPPS